MAADRDFRGVLPAGTTAVTAFDPGHPSLWARLVARLRADDLDRALAVGAPVPPGSPLAAHAARLASPAERRAVAGALLEAVREARRGHGPFSNRIPVHTENVLRAEELIEAFVLRLRAPHPVGVRGMARLRRILADGAGPLNRDGRGDLAGRLGAALAAL